MAKSNFHQLWDAAFDWVSVEQRLGADPGDSQPGPQGRPDLGSTSLGTSFDPRSLVCQA